LVANPSLYAVEVRNPDQQGIGARFPATIGTPPPGVITSVTPNSTSATRSAFTVTITGTGFSANPTVSLGMTSLRVISASATSVVAEVPGSANVAGTYILGVTDPTSNATAQSPTPFVISQGPIVDPSLAPTIGSVTPPSGTRVSQVPFQLTVTGTNFTPGTVVQFGATTLSAVGTATSTSLTVSVPPTIAGLYTLIITNNTGQRVTQQYSILNPDSTVNNTPRPQITTTNVISVQRMAGVRVFPNPVVDNFTVEASLEKAAQVVINVTNVLGQRVLMITQDANAGFFTKQINVSTLPAGAYMVEITDGTRRSIEQIVKQ